MVAAGFGVIGIAFAVALGVSKRTKTARSRRACKSRKRIKSDIRNELTKAAGITADVVMELGAFFSAQDMCKVQTGLTNAARELRSLTHHSSLLGRLGEKLSHEQRELLTNAAALLDSVK
jgi:uncharacterized protein (DUF1778 family)